MVRGPHRLVIYHWKALDLLDINLIKSKKVFLIKLPFYETFLHINIHCVVGTDTARDLSTDFQRYFSKAGLTPVKGSLIHDRPSFLQGS